MSNNKTTFVPKQADMKGKVVIAGGTGFIGNYLKKRFEHEGYEVLIISRGSSSIHWDDNEAMVAAIDNAEMVINLAGKPINTRFTESNKEELVSSRVNTTLSIGKAISQCANPPSTWFNASGAHIYGTKDQKAFTEADPLDDEFFPAVMAQKWEDALEQCKLPKTRKVALRISIVLGKDGGVLQPYLMLSKLLLGGKHGSGQQKFSWLHLEDFFEIILFVHQNKNINGPINLCSPEVVSNAELMQTIRKCLGVPFGFPAPAFGIKIGASMMGIEPDLILSSLSVYPQKLIQAGYQFRYPKLKDALAEIIK